MKGLAAALVLMAVAGGARLDLARLEGDWVIDLRPRSGAHTPLHHGVVTLSLQVVAKPHQAKLLQGPYSLAVQGLTRPDPCITTGGTARVIQVKGDSVRIDLRQGFNCGLRIAGRVRGDSVTGTWSQPSPSGTLARGRFSMTRRRPPDD